MAIYSVTRLGDFWKFLATNLLTKVAQKHWWLLGLFWKGYLNVKTAVAYIWVTYGNFWATFLLQYLVTLAICDFWMNPFVVRIYFKKHILDISQVHDDQKFKLTIFAPTMKQNIGIKERLKRAFFDNDWLI